MQKVSIVDLDEEIDLLKSGKKTNLIVSFLEIDLIDQDLKIISHPGYKYRNYGNNQFNDYCHFDHEATPSEERTQYNEWKEIVYEKFQEIYVEGFYIIVEKFNLIFYSKKDSFENRVYRMIRRGENYSLRGPNGEKYKPFVSVSLIE